MIHDSTISNQLGSDKGIDRNEEQLRVAIVADIHLMAESLLIQSGDSNEAFEQYMTKDRKMLQESTALVKELTQKLIEKRPRYVLVAGDLTKDGELVSHEQLCEICFKPLLEAGIQTLVIPGNHDIANHHAVEFNGASSERVETISANDFASIYNDFGYSGAVSLDKNSLSYIYRLSPTLQLLAIDSCLYHLNSPEQIKPHHEGEVKSSTLKYIEKQLKKSQAEGIRTIAMMHHGAIEHWSYQKKMIPGYIVNNDKKINKLLTKYGVEVVFTGHSHAQDIAYDKGLYDVQTGSIVSYPCPYRVVSIDNEQMSIESYRVEKIDFDLGGRSLEEYSRENTENGFKHYIEQIFPSSIPTKITQRATDLIAEGIRLHYAGDEYFSQEYRNELKRIYKSSRKHSWMWSIAFKRVIKALLTEQSVADNNLTIRFQHPIQKQIE